MIETGKAKLDPTVGSESQKTRPCAEISPDDMNAHLRTVIVARGLAAQGGQLVMRAAASPAHAAPHAGNLLATKEACSCRGVISMTIALPTGLQRRSGARRVGSDRDLARPFAQRVLIHLFACAMARNSLPPGAAASKAADVVDNE